MVPKQLKSETGKITMTKTNTQLVKEATQKWIGEWNAIPQSIIMKAYPMMEEDGLNILATTLKCPGCDDDIERGETCHECDSGGVDFYDFPMWGTMWTFGDSLDDDWARINLDVFRDLGIWVYESDELGILLGIDGAGYNFYEAHWMPLYEARGLQYHKYM